MVYSSRFVACVLVDGQPAKEMANGVVPILFSRQYSLRFRNKNDRRAVVRFTIDGENVSGEGFIIPPNSAIDIHRHWKTDAAFKFVGLDSPDAIDQGKNGPNTDGSKGVIEAKFYLEKSWPIPVGTPAPILHFGPQPSWGMCSSDGSWSNAACGELPTLSDKSVQRRVVAERLHPPTNLQEGCTVEGKATGQTWRTEYIDLETDYVALKLVLKGFHGESDPAMNSYCIKCGAKRSRPADNFCGVCGQRF